MIGVDAPPLTARFYRVRAKEIRDAAEQIQEESSRASLLEIARDFEAMTEYAEKYGRR